jgi:hypothetical protein
MSRVKSLGSDTIEVVLLLRAVAQTLPVVTVEDSSVSPALTEFEARRRNHIGGFFIDRAAIAHWESSRIYELLEAKIPGVRPRVSPDQKVKVFSTRGNGSILRSADCQVEVFLDCVRLSDGDANIIPLSQLAGIEYYPPGFVPPQYHTLAAAESKTPGGSQCGVLLLWRRPP